MGNEIVAGIAVDFTAMQKAREQDAQAWREWAKKNENSITGLTRKIQDETVAQAKNNPLTRFMQGEKGQGAASSFVRQAIMGDPLGALADNAERLTKSAKLGFGIGIGVAAAVGLYEVFQKVNAESDAMTDKMQKGMLVALQASRTGASLGEIGSAKNQLGTIRRENQMQELSRGPLEWIMAGVVKGVEYLFPKPKAFDEQSEKTVGRSLIRRSVEVVQGESAILQAGRDNQAEQSELLKTQHAYHLRIVEAKTAGLDSAAKELAIQQQIAESIIKSSHAEERRKELGKRRENEIEKGKTLSDLQFEKDKLEARQGDSTDRQRDLEADTRKLYKDIESGKYGFDPVKKAEKENELLRKQGELEQARKEEFRTRQGQDVEFNRQMILNDRGGNFRGIRAGMYGLREQMGELGQETDPMRKRQLENSLAQNLGSLQQQEMQLLSRPTIADSLQRVGGGGGFDTSTNTTTILRDMRDIMRQVRDALQPRSVEVAAQVWQ